eukprot:6729300-Ditylum_brightwellii.AAC.1
MAPDIQKAFLSGNTATPLVDQTIATNRACQLLIQKEESRSFWWSVNYFQDKTKLGNVFFVSQKENGETAIHVSKEVVEACIISEVSKCFRLTKRWSLFHQGYVATLLGLSGETHVAQ